MIDLSSQAALYALGRLRDRFFGGRRFSPGTPLQPISPTSGAPDAALNAPLPTAPRQFQYPAYVNIVPAPRREYPQLTPFQLLRNLATAYDVAALCIATRIEQFQGLGWAIAARDKRQQSALQSECAVLERWWAQPDGQQDFSAWLSMYLRDIYQIDAATLYPRRDAGGRLHSLEVVDGATIKPVLDDRGRTVGYQQILYGMPETQFQRPGDEDTIPDFAVDELIYRPRWPSSFSPYGCPPTEWIITRIKTALAKQAFDLAMFTEGNIPAALATPPEGQLNPEQVAQFQDWFNATLEGDIARGHKLLFLPWAARIERLKELTEGGRYESSLDDYMLKVTLAAFGVTPSEIGITDDVNRATGESQENVTYRRGILPLAVWLKQGFDRSLAHLTGEYRVVVSLPGQPTRQTQRLCDLVAWRWAFGESEDLTRLAQTDQAYYTIGVLSPDEIRAMRFADEVEGDAPGPPATGAPPLPGVPVDGSPQATKVAKRTADDELSEAEQRALTVIERIYGTQVAEITAAITDATDVRAAVAARWPALQSLFQQQVLPLFDALMGLATQEAAGLVDVAPDWEQVNEAALDYARERATALAMQSTTTSRAQVDRIIANWIDDGGTMPELLSRVALVWRGPRARTTAISEVTHIYAAANRATWAATGVVKGYIVQSVRDESVCPICRQHQGERYPIDDTAHLPPYHGSCRCFIRPVVLSAKEFETR